MAQTMINFRMDEDLKRRMEQTCKKMGLTMTAAFTMFAAKVTRDQRIPFEIVPSKNAPTEETRLAMLRAEAKAAGLIPDGDPGFTDPDEFFASLEA